MTQTFLISWPPSCNSIWRAVHGRNILSARYRQWRDNAGKELIAQRPKVVQGPVRISIELSPPHSRPYDIDNRAKPLLDLLVSLNIIASDNHATVQRLELSAAKGFTGARVTITPLHAEQAREEVAA